MSPLRPSRRPSLLRLAAAALVAAALALGPARDAGAQGQQSVQVIPPAGGDTLRTVTPTFTVQAVATGPGPLRYRFELSETETFAAPVLDTSIVTNATTFTVRPTRALLGGRPIYWRATVINPAGLVSTSPVGGPRLVPAWLRPLAPVGASGTVVYTQRPRFVWSRPQVGEPPGPWEYTLQVTGAAGEIQTTTRDTVVDFAALPQAELERNASYTWTVVARLPSTGQQASFTIGGFTVIDSAVTPTATLLFQNFPNPFPSATRRTTCIWLDIARETRATLEIFTLRGVRVRRLLPNPQVGEVLGARYYGRALAGSNAGCDPNFEWDGTDDRGTRLPAGVYLLRFRADGVETVKKIVFRG